MTFYECVIECSNNKELVQQFDRLASTNLQRRGAPIILMVDEATGKLADDWLKFIKFVDDVIWQRMTG